MKRMNNYMRKSVITSARRALDLATAYLGFAHQWHGAYPVRYGDRNIVSFKVSSSEGLQEMRRELRLFFGSWNDRLTFIGATYGDQAVAEYRGREKYNGLEVKLRLCMDRDEFPIKQPGCGFESESRLSYSYVCKGKK